jgi:YrbI family 3-deoxy-D-manno-octulosonate 8-phosphate phosphatase
MTPIASLGKGTPDGRKVMAIIPARGGSKAIPRKNLIELGGKPLLSYVIAAALGSTRVTDVVVSTDDREIADWARRCGARVVDRPAELSRDESSSEDALAHVLAQAKSDGTSEPDIVVFLQATSPLTSSADVDAAVDLLESSKADSLLSVSPLRGFVWRIRDEVPEPLNYDVRERPRRQDAPEDVVENGALYAFRPWVLRDLGTRVGGKVVAYRMNPASYFQLDDPEDVPVLDALVSSGVASPARSSTRWEAIRLLVLDFDGVMTDNRVMVDGDGGEAVHCDRSDGYGVEQLRRAGLDVLVISKERNPVVAARCKKLHLEFVQGCDDKLRELEHQADRRRVRREEIAYVGNDVNDLECMRWVGLPIAVADAMDECRRAAAFITVRLGGRGAVREVADHWLRAHRHPPASL